MNSCSFSHMKIWICGEIVELPVRPAPAILPPFAFGGWVLAADSDWTISGGWRPLLIGREFRPLFVIWTEWRPRRAYPNWPSSSILAINWTRYICLFVCCCIFGSHNFSNISQRPILITHLSPSLQDLWFGYTIYYRLEVGSKWSFLMLNGPCLRCCCHWSARSCYPGCHWHACIPLHMYTVPLKEL